MVAVIALQLSTANEVQKPKAQEQPAPKRVRKSTDTSAKKSKVVKPVTLWNTLAHEANLPIDVTYEGGSVHARTLKNGDQGHAIKLIAPIPFTLVKSASCTIPEMLPNVELRRLHIDAPHRG